MKISVVSMWYNEAFLAPFFLKHYQYVDRIHILLDTDSDDRTKEICKHYSNVKIEDFTFPDMFDCILMVGKINDVVAGMDSDWVFAVDADELIFPPNGENPKEMLSRQGGNLLYVQMWQVYRHATDVDLDPEQPAIYQRRHGDSNITVGINNLYIKPIIIRPEIKIKWYPGCHEHEANERINVSPERFLGVHWAMADVEMAIERRIKGRKERHGKINLQYGMGIQDRFITEEIIREQCDGHLNDPLLF